MNPTPEREALVLSQYGHLWAKTAEKAEGLLGAGETELNRIILMMRRDFGADFSDPVLIKKNQERDLERRKTGFILDRQHIRSVEVDSPTATLMIEALKMRTLMELTRGAERIVELGAGWGKNLFKLWLYGAPLDAEYHALELTPEARNLAKRVAQSAAPKMPFFTHAFDYYRPDFSMFAEAKPTVVFSHHSLEQIPSVGERLFEAIKGIPGLIRVVHLEPVGFQVPGATWLENVRPDRMEYIDSLNRAFATKRDQNLNLYPILRSMELEGSIRLTRVRKHFCSILLKNATTLLVWEPNGTPSLTTPETQRDDLQEPPPQPSVWTRLRRKVGKRILGETNAGSQIH